MADGSRSNESDLPLAKRKSVQPEKKGIKKKAAEAAQDRKKAKQAQEVEPSE